LSTTPLSLIGPSAIANLDPRDERLEHVAGYLSQSTLEGNVPNGVRTSACSRVQT
jgi:hypothetical protein